MHERMEHDHVQWSVSAFSVTFELKLNRENAKNAKVF